MDKPEATKGTVPEGISRLPQPMTTDEIKQWSPVAVAFNELTKGQGIDLVAERRSRLKSVRNGETQYASLATFMEMAATILASGGSFRQAGRAVGRTSTTVRHWMEIPRFRERVGELQAIAGQQISGRILAEFEKRTRPDQLEKLEVLDLTRIYDRVVDRTPAALDRKAEADGEDEFTKYEHLTQQIILVNSGGKGTDFPVYTPEDLRLSSGDPQE